MSKTKKLFALLLSGAMCFSLAFAAACGGGSDSNGDGDGDGDGGTPAVQTTTATVTYDSNGGSSVDASTVEVGSTLGTLPTPTRTGYNFLGWYYVNGTEEVEYTGALPVGGDMTLTAKWSEWGDFYLGEQNRLVVETGNQFYCYMRSDDIDEDAYVTITKSGTTKTVEEATSAGWIIDSVVRIYSYYICTVLYFGQAGDYTITAYSYAQTCRTVVTAIGDTITAPNFTASTVSLNKITYLGSDYTSGSNITIYSTISNEYIYFYFNAPKASEYKVTYSYTDTEYNTTYSGILGSTLSSNGTGSGYSDGKFYVYLRPNFLVSGYTYTVKLTSASNGSVESSFTYVAPAAATETKLLTTLDSTKTVAVNNYFNDYYYVLSSEEIITVNCVVKDSSGNTVSSEISTLSVGYYADSYGVYYINYNGQITATGTYTVTITPYDSESQEITALAQTVTITVASSTGYFNWNLVQTDTENNSNYSQYFVEGETKTIQFTADAELSKVTVCGVYINTSTATTITKDNGTTISAIYSVADGVTTVSLTITAAGSGDIRFSLLGSNDDGSTYSNSSYMTLSVYSSSTITSAQNKVAAAKYSLETYFADLIVEGGALNSVYTKLQAYTVANTGASYGEALDLFSAVSSAVISLSTNVYNSETDYFSSLRTALARKTSLCDSILYEYCSRYSGSYSAYILTSNSISSNINLYYLGLESYVLLQVSDKTICDYMYERYFANEDIDELIEEYDEAYNGTISALVTAHDSGTEAEYIAAWNEFYLSMYAVNVY